MEREFKVPTREEALRLADEWWKAQAGLTTITRHVFAAHNTQPGLDTTNVWIVPIHYRRA